MRPKSYTHEFGLRLDIDIRYIGLGLGLGCHVMFLWDDNIGKAAKYFSGNLTDSLLGRSLNHRHTS